jgi:hypothetical protein
MQDSRLRSTSSLHLPAISSNCYQQATPNLIFNSTPEVGRHLHAITHPHPHCSNLFRLGRERQNLLFLYPWLS